MADITKEELLERLFHDDYERLRGKKNHARPGAGRTFSTSCGAAFWEPSDPLPATRL